MQANESFAPQAPEQAEDTLPSVKAPVPLDPQLLRFVSGGGPRGTWEASDTAAAATPAGGEN